MAMCGNHIQRVKIVINNNPIEQVSEFKYLGYRISDCKRDLEDKVQTYNKINDVI
jgi:predicted SPOUT superfamily RNA methylase MTH1